MLNKFFSRRVCNDAGTCYVSEIWSEGTGINKKEMSVPSCCSIRRALHDEIQNYCQSTGEVHAKAVKSLAML